MQRQSLFNVCFGTSYHLIIIFILLINTNSSVAQSSSGATITYTYKIISSANNTFGYDIYGNDKMKIHQPNIPGSVGNNGFKTKADAQKVAELVIHKMKNNQMPPTVTKEELKKLKIEEA